MSAFPSVAQVRQIPVTKSLTVGPEHIDENGHMNVRHYYDVAEQASVDEFTSWGVGVDYPDQTGFGIFTVQQHLTFLSEVLKGEQVSVHLRVSDRTPKFVHTHAYLVNDARDEIAQITETLVAHVSMETRKTAPWPDVVADALDEAISQSEELDWSSTPGGPIALRK